MTKALRDARIGYAGYKADFRHPGDRRRFCAYAAMRGLSYEYPQLDAHYDLVLVTHNGDISGWTWRKQREGDRLKFVFELVDSYLVHTSPVRRLLKGSGRYVLGTDSRLSPDFLKTLIKACEAADAVLCSTIEQQEAIRPYNPNVFVSFDHVAIDLGRPKQDYRRQGKLRLAWEGQSTTVPNLQIIREPINAVSSELDLHVVTDPVIYRYFGRFRGYPAMQALEGIRCAKHFHEWQKESFGGHLTQADLGVIPINPDNRLWWGKPENKLVLLWKLGLPVLATATPAYSRAMAEAGVPEMACASSTDWEQQIERFLDADPGELERIGRHCRSFAEKHYSPDEFARRFGQAFTAAGFDTAV